LENPLFHGAQKGTVDLPNFEHVPYFEHHVNKQFIYNVCNFL